MKPKYRRLTLILCTLALLAAAVTLALNAFQQSIIYFYSPYEWQQQKQHAKNVVRIGGLVVEGSISQDGDVHIFALTDKKASVTVRYHGLLPGLFRAGQGIVAEGTANDDGSLQAVRVLAKHDENYMPKEVYEKLKKTAEEKP